MKKSKMLRSLTSASCAVAGLMLGVSPSAESAEISVAMYSLVTGAYVTTVNSPAGFDVDLDWPHNYPPLDTQGYDWSELLKTGRVIGTGGRVVGFAFDWLGAEGHNSPGMFYLTPEDLNSNATWNFNVSGDANIFGRLDSFIFIGGAYDGQDVILNTNILGIGTDLISHVRSDGC